jgi:hypothetical protein
MDKVSCETCAFRREWECHRFPPTVFMHPLKINDQTALDYTQSRPSVNQDDWCGEYMHWQEGVMT